MFSHTIKELFPRFETTNNLFIQILSFGLVFLAIALVVVTKYKFQFDFSTVNLSTLDINIEKIFNFSSSTYDKINDKELIEQKDIGYFETLKVYYDKYWDPKSSFLIYLSTYIRIIGTLRYKLYGTFIYTIIFTLLIFILEYFAEIQYVANIFFQWVISLNIDISFLIQ